MRNQNWSALVGRQARRREEEGKAVKRSLRVETSLGDSETCWGTAVGEKEVSGREEGIQLKVSFVPPF